MITVKHGVFHLQNEKNSYLFRVRDGFLEHLHFGARVSASDADALAVRPGCGAEEMYFEELEETEDG